MKQAKKQVRIRAKRPVKAPTKKPVKAPAKKKASARKPPRPHVRKPSAKQAVKAPAKRPVKTIAETLPSLDETLERLRAVERRYPDGVRIEQTRLAIEANERFAKDRTAMDRFLGHLGSKDMFTPIYGMGNTPNGLPVCLPAYLMEILVASSRVLCALSRKVLREKGPQLLIDRMPQGWVSAGMAERLHEYSLTHEPDMGFDVLVYGTHSHRGMTFDEFKKSGDMLYAKLLEAQSVDTYFGWAREFIRGARLAGLVAPRHQFVWCTDAVGRVLSDEAMDREVVATLNWGLESQPESIQFLEVDPETQPSGQNLKFMADAMSGGDARHRPVILDPRDVEFRGAKLHATKPGLEREIKKVISRLVDVDLRAWVKAREADGGTAVIERLRRIYDTPALFSDMSKHLCGFYLVDKSSLTEMSLLGDVGIAPKTELLSAAHVARYRTDAALLKRIAIKPLHGMSAKGVVVSPTLVQVEEALAQEAMLVQETIWATPVLPCVTPEIADPDVQAGICSETRLVLQAGSPAVPHNPYGARVIAGLSRSHFQSRDPERKIKNDPKQRGWYSNMGSILAVKAELGITNKNDAGIGMGPIYSLL
jgi:hypothetical protein